MWQAWEKEKYIRNFRRKMRRKERFGRSGLDGKLVQNKSQRSITKGPGLDSSDSG
jgi:hypothetical protein